MDKISQSFELKKGSILKLNLRTGQKIKQETQDWPKDALTKLHHHTNGLNIALHFS